MTHTLDSKTLLTRIKRILQRYLASPLCRAPIRAAPRDWVGLNRDWPLPIQDAYRAAVTAWAWARDSARWPDILADSFDSLSTTLLHWRACLRIVEGELGEARAKMGRRFTYPGGWFAASSTAHAACLQALGDLVRGYQIGFRYTPAGRPALEELEKRRAT